MTTTRRGTATGADTRATRSRGQNTSVRIYREVGLTIAITDDPPQFVKLVCGQEIIAPDDTNATVKEYKRKLDTQLETDIAEQQRRYTKMHAEIKAELKSGRPSKPGTGSRRRRAR